MSTKYENLSELVQARRRVSQAFSSLHFIEDLKVEFLNRNFQFSLVNFLNYIGFAEKAPDVSQGSDLIIYIYIYLFIYLRTNMTNIQSTVE